MKHNIALEILEIVSGKQKQVKDFTSIPCNIAIEAIQESYERGFKAGTEDVLSAIREMFNGRDDK